MPDLRRVEIGGGPQPQKLDWEQYDAIDWSERTGLRYTLGDIRALPYNDESVAEIFASNVLEHVSFLDTNRTLREWRRVLVPGGLLTVVVPDLLGLINDFGEGVNTWDQFVERVYGSQTYDLDLHRAGFTVARFPAVLHAAGYQVEECKSTHAGGGITAMGRRKEEP